MKRIRLGDKVVGIFKVIKDKRRPQDKRIRLQVRRGLNSP